MWQKWTAPLASAVFMLLACSSRDDESRPDSCARAAVEPIMEGFDGFHLREARLTDAGLLLLMERSQEPTHLLIGMHRTDDTLYTYQMARSATSTAEIDQPFQDRLNARFQVVDQDPKVRACADLLLPKAAKAEDVYAKLDYLYRSTLFPETLEDGGGEASLPITAGVVGLLALVAVAVVLTLRRRRMAPGAGTGSPPPAEGTGHDAGPSEGQASGSVAEGSGSSPEGTGPAAEATGSPEEGTAPSAGGTGSPEPAVEPPSAAPSAGIADKPSR